MTALAAGCGGKVCQGAPPDDGLFAVWGHKWLSETIIPSAAASGRPWWFVDNGYHLPARGEATGYYSLTYRGFSPVLLDDPDMGRLGIEMAPWRRDQGGYVLLALPGMAYGRMLGHDMPGWSAMIKQKIKKYTRRPVVVRDKRSRRPLAADLAGAFCVVTHSSKVAVDAVIAGVPAVVAPTNPAAPVCSTDLTEIERPKMPERAHWWASLMAQQFTLDEMKCGFAASMMRKIREKADAGL